MIAVEEVVGIGDVVAAVVGEEVVGIAVVVVEEGEVVVADYDTLGVVVVDFVEVLDRQEGQEDQEQNLGEEDG